MFLLRVFIRSAYSNRAIYRILDGVIYELPKVYIRIVAKVGNRVLKVLAIYRLLA